MSHYFTSPEGPDERRTITALIGGRRVEVETSRGVFSGDGLDHATALLLQTCTPHAASHAFLDLGCGWGPIACHLGFLAPGADILAVDVNDRALELTRDNAARLGLTVHVQRPEDVDPGLRFDEIWSNPPIRIGKQAMHEMLQLWLGRLAPDGVAHLVVGKNLGADSLARWLAEEGWHVERVTSSKGFRVLDVTPRLKTA